MLRCSSGSFFIPLVRSVLTCIPRKVASKNAKCRRSTANTPHTSQPYAATSREAALLDTSGRTSLALTASSRSVAANKSSSALIQRHHGAVSSRGFVRSIAKSSRYAFFCHVRPSFLSPQPRSLHFVLVRQSDRPALSASCAVHEDYWYRLSDYWSTTFCCISTHNLITD